MPQEREVKTGVFLGAEGSIVSSAIMLCCGYSLLFNFF